MIRNYLKVSLRFLFRNKLFSIINIVGLAIGMAATLLIILWVVDEISFDRYHKKQKSLYRIISVRNLGNEITDNARTPNPLGVEAMESFPEIKNFFRYQGVEAWPLKTKEISSIEEVLACADPSIFEMLSFKFIDGDKISAFSAKNSMVITKGMANRFFGKIDAVGESITLFEDEEFTITGIIDEIPENSHIMFDCIVPISNFERYWEQDFTDWNTDLLMFYTYFELQERTDPEILSGLLYKNFESQLKESHIEGIKFQRLKDIHLDSEIIEQDLDNYNKGNKSLVYLFILIALGILIIACINFINLSTAGSIIRLKEIKIRRVLGSRKNQLVFQFISESVIISFIAHILAMFIIELFIPSFNELTNKHILIDYSNPVLFLLIILMLVFIGIGAGTFPAFYLTRKFQNQLIGASGIIKRKSSKLNIRKVLVVFQFVISSTLIVSSLFIYKQIRYAQNKDLGYDHENIVRLHRTHTFSRNFETKRSILLQYPDVISISKSGSIFNFGEGQEDISWEGKEPQSDFIIYQLGVDSEFINTYGLKIIDGRGFSSDFGTDSLNYILNETAVLSMNLNDPIGKRITYRGREGRIVGVVKDFHQTSLHDPIRPMIFFIDSDVPMISIKIKSKNRDKTLKFLETKWYEFAGEDMPFRHDFVEDVIANSYNNDKRIATFIKYFTILSIFIASMGLLGLSILSIKQRTKEIGIRKVNGAKTIDVIIIMIKNYLILVLAGFIISIPISYKIVQNWMNNFEYKTHINSWVFLAVFLGLVVLTILTVGISTFRTSNSNPVDSLKYE